MYKRVTGYKIKHLCEKQGASLLLALCIHAILCGCKNYYYFKHYITDIYFQRLVDVHSSTVQLTTKFTLVCTIHACVYQFYSRDWLELACHRMRVIPRALLLHASHTSCAHSSHTSSATRELDMACCTRVRPHALHASHCT